jgi:hypothetical protein
MRSLCSYLRRAATCAVSDSALREVALEVHAKTQHFSVPKNNLLIGNALSCGLL